VLDAPAIPRKPHSNRSCAPLALPAGVLATWLAQRQAGRVAGPLPSTWQKRGEGQAALLARFRVPLLPCSDCSLRKGTLRAFLCVVSLTRRAGQRSQRTCPTGLYVLSSFACPPSWRPEIKLLAFAPRSEHPSCSVLLSFCLPVG
jgi:hypothetical protein